MALCMRVLILLRAIVTGSQIQDGRRFPAGNAPALPVSPRDGDFRLTRYPNARMYIPSAMNGGFCGRRTPDPLARGMGEDRRLCRGLAPTRRQGSRHTRSME